MRLPLGPFSLLIGWYVDMMAGARAAFLTTRVKKLMGSCVLNIAQQQERRTLSL